MEADVPHLHVLFKDLTEAIITRKESKHILDEILERGALTSSEHAMFQTKISFLPSDAAGLWEKLKFHGTEYKAGNTTTRNELVAVLDELKRQGEITSEEYTSMNTNLFMGSGIDVLWQNLKLIGPEYKAGNNTREMIAVLDDLLRLNQIFREEYSKMLKRGGGIYSVQDNTYAKRLEEIIDNAELSGLVKQLFARNHKIREDIDQTLPRESTVAEIQIILNLIERINNVVKTILPRLENEELDFILGQMFKDREIDDKLKADIVKSLSKNVKQMKNNCDKT